MKVWKVVAILVLVYVAIVATFESLIGYLQPAGGSTVVITTFDADGSPHERVVSGLTSNGQLYVAANHWPRAWYRRALERPEVQVTADGAKRDYRAVCVTGAERDRVESEYPHGMVFLFLTGFPPRHFLRLDPR
jgi:hypothetical protein